MTCAELEILLCDYLDGTLPPTQKIALEQHLVACNSCAEFANDVSAATEFIETAAPTEPPRELVTRILQHIPAATGRESWWQRLRDGWVLQPRFVLGMAMTLLS